MRTTLLTIFGLFAILSLFGQSLNTEISPKNETIRVPLERQIGVGPFSSFSILLSKSVSNKTDRFYGVYESAELEFDGYEDYIFTVGSLQTNFLQNVWSKVNYGQANKDLLELYEDLRTKEGREDLGIVNEFVDTEISLVILQKEDNYVLFIDKNNDNVLESHERHVVKRTKPWHTTQVFSAAVDRVENGRIKKDSTHFDIKLGDYISLGIREHYQAKLKLQKQDLYIYARSGGPNSLNLTDEYLDVFVSDKEQILKESFFIGPEYESLNPRDVFKASNKQFMIIGVENNELLLKEVPINQRIVGTQVGAYAPEIKGFDLANEPIDFNKEKFKFIDFWATWCAPCIEELPTLYDIHEFFKQEIEFISIADDKRERVEKFLEGRDIGWRTYLVNDLNEVKENFGITGIPRGFLLDKENKVLVKEYKLRGHRAIESIATALKIPNEEIQKRVDRGNVLFRLKNTDDLISATIRAEFSPMRMLPMYKSFFGKTEMTRGVEIEKGTYLMQLSYVTKEDFKKRFKSMELVITGEPNQVIEIDLN